MSNLLSIVRCPDCHHPELHEISPQLWVCPNCAVEFPVVSGRPVLLRHDNEVFSIDAYTACIDSKPTPRFRPRWVPDISVNLSRDRIFTALAPLLPTDAQILVVGGGQQRDALASQLRLDDVDNQLICTDVDILAEVDLFCDGHELPFEDKIFDAVITTAVLEHVLYPENAATEIYRVLKIDGILYSELPFIQQVHEGAYDFTRYTLSGHRRLFNGFSKIDSGMVAGPATALLWSIENFVLAFFSRPVFRNAAKLLIRLTLFWVKYLDYFLQYRPEAMDGASCTYFFGRKSANTISDVNIVNGYVGAKHVRHT